MGTAEVRLAELEGKFMGHELRQDDLAQAVARLEERVDRRFDANDKRFSGIEHRLDRLDDKVSRQFIWLAGMQMTVLITLVAALTAALFAR